MEFLIQRRKVAARVRLADSSVLEGALYAAIEGRRGAPETLTDRLNDTTERYLPFALEDRHLLLNKAHIIAVHLTDEDQAQVEGPPSEQSKEFHLMLRLSDRTTVMGTTHATLPADHSRALDYLNDRAARFIDIVIDDHVFLVNRDYVVAVTEVFSSDRGKGRVWEPFGPAGDFTSSPKPPRARRPSRDQS